MKNYCIYFSLLLSLHGTSVAQLLPYQNKQLPIEKRVDDLLQRLTLDEKLNLLIIASDTGKMGKISVGKLGFLNHGLPPREAALQYNRIARYMKHKTQYGIVGLRSAEGIFAYMGNGSTAFPVPLAQASSWDPAIVRSVAGVIYTEARSRGVRQLLSPVLNMGRDPRWGRTSETYGEDPYLVAQMGLAYVAYMEKNKMATVVKHFAGNTGHDGKFGSSVFYSERYYREYEFLPYEVAIKQGGSQGVMMAYNTGDGIPFAQNAWMMNKYLKEELGFKGIIMSDGGGLQLIQEAYGIDSTDVGIVAACINAGCDIALDKPKYYNEALKIAVSQGKVSMARIDEAARRVLRVHFTTETYDNPYTDPDIAAQVNDSPQHRAIALEVAKQSIVLLKNKENTLPFSKKLKNILVTGYLGDRLLINHYGGWGRKEVTIKEGVKNLLPQSEVVYAKGAGVGFTFYPTISESHLYFVDGTTRKKGLKASYYDNTNFEGEPKYTQVDAAIDFDWGEGAPKNLDKDKFSIRWEGYITIDETNMYTLGVHADDKLTVYIDDKPVVDMRQGTRNAIFVEKGEVYLEKGKTYTLRAEYVENGGKAFAQLGWNAKNPYLQPALDAAQQAEAIIVVVGMFDDENGDRAILDLDPMQEQLIIEMAKINKPMVVVLQSANVITMRNWVHKVPAILQAWYPGEEGGNAVAQILFGEHNPSGKLPITIPKTTGQVPITYNRFPGKDTRPVDRGLDRFFDVGNEPQFHFGYGLSYTTFELSNMRLSQTQISSGQQVQVYVDVQNTGKVAGYEVVQLYIHDPIASVSRPIKELKGFTKVYLQPGERKTVSISLQADQLMFYDTNMRKVLEPGHIHVMIGNASNHIIDTHILTVK